MLGPITFQYCVYAKLTIIKRELSWCHTVAKCDICFRNSVRLVVCHKRIRSVVSWCHFITNRRCDSEAKLVPRHIWMT